TCTDPREAVVSAIRALAAEPMSAPFGTPSAIVDVLALVLAGARTDKGGPGLTDAALRVVRATGWSPEQLDSARASDIDALAAALTPDPAGPDDGWTTVTFAGPSAGDDVDQLLADL